MERGYPAGRVIQPGDFRLRQAYRVFDVVDQHYSLARYGIEKRVVEAWAANTQGFKHQAVDFDLVGDASVISMAPLGMCHAAFEENSANRIIGEPTRQYFVEGRAHVRGRFAFKNRQVAPGDQGIQRATHGPSGFALPRCVLSRVPASGHTGPGYSIGVRS